MFLNDFNPKGTQTVAKINKVLKEEFNINISHKTPSKSKLVKILETADLALNRLRNTNVYYQTHPEYAKYLGIRNAIRLMLQEGMYAESPAFVEMKKMISDSVHQLMDSGYTDDEAVAECMNRYRMDNRYAYGDEYVLPMVITAAKQYVEQCKMESAQLEAMQEAEADVSGQGAPEFGNTDLKDIGLMELARECGISLEDTGSLDLVEQQLETFARVSGKSRDAIVEFINSLDESQVVAGIQMFGRKVAEANAFVKARRDAVRTGKKEFEVGGKTFKVTGNTTDELKEGATRSPRGSVSLNKAGQKAVKNIKKAEADKNKKKKTQDLSEGSERPYVAVHVNKGKTEVTANSSYEAAKRAAAKWKLKSTTGISVYLADVKHTATESVFNSIISGMIVEDVDVQEAEVIMAVRALADDIQDHVERIGRMMNEDVPAIADQMRHEMGAETAQAFLDNATSVLGTYLESAKTSKSGLDQAISTVSGEQLPAAQTAELPAEPEIDQTAAAEPEQDLNEPAAGGVEGEPLGRAQVAI
jgi:arsenate reductase-like glutaredoxin family protein